MLKELIPPFFVRSLTGLFYGWRGNYSSWKEAEKKCTGYDNRVILEKVKESLLKVKNGESVFERDSVLFDKIQYSFPLLSALNHIVYKSSGILNVLDFGGSLGSSYYQNKHLFSDLKEFNWCIVEQKHFVEEGEKSFADNHLHFYYEVVDCLKERKINLFLFASVLQYLENPYDYIKQAMSSRAEYIFIDRTPFYHNKERITIQKVPKSIYEAQYPCWILNEKKMMDIITDDYELVYDAVSPESINIKDAQLKAYFFKRKK